MKPIKIVYIVSTGHSGSTLLDILIGSHPKGESMGEIIWLMNHFDRQKDEKCGCLNTYSECPLWGKALPAWEKAVGKSGVEEYKRLQKIFEFPASPSIWLLFKKTYVRHKEFPLFSKLTYELYKNIQRVNNADFLVDSSKNPARLYSLINNPFLDVYPIHLTKDPRGNVYSAFKKRLNNTTGKKHYSPLRISIGWILHNFQSAKVAKESKQEHSMHISYESLVTEPITTISNIAEFIGEDFSSLVQKINNKQPITIKHLFAGNGIHLQKDLVIKPDLIWKSKLPKFLSKQIWFLTGWYSKKFGYTKKE